MRRTFLCFAAISAVAIVLCSGSTTEGQILRFGRMDGFRLRTPSFSIAVSPWGATTIGSYYGPRYGHYGPHDFPAAPPTPYHPSPWLAPQSSHYAFREADLFDRFSPPGSYSSRPAWESDKGVSSRYTSPQDRYAWPVSPYGAAARPSGSSSYSLGAPSAADPRWSQAETTRRLPFARSPYDAGQARGFGVTGTAPARSLSDRELTDALVRAASELDEALAAQQDGDIWQEYLQPTMIADAFRSTSATTTDAESLRRLWINFEATRGNPELRWLTEVDGFAATNELLNEWLRRQSAGDEGSWEIETDGEIEASPEIEADRETIEVEELPAPAAEQPKSDPSQAERPQLNPPQVEQPRTDPPRRYEL